MLSPSNIIQKIKIQTGNVSYFKPTLFSHSAIFVSGTLSVNLNVIGGFDVCVQRSLTNVYIPRLSIYLLNAVLK